MGCRSGRNGLVGSRRTPFHATLHTFPDHLEIKAATRVDLRLSNPQFVTARHPCYFPSSVIIVHDGEFVQRFPAG